MQYGHRETSENLKEQRIQYFLEHYHSKQEVLYRLPLNIPISSFWPELLNRRRAKATVLPLHNAGGMPYWFVLTEKMVAASERLSQEAVTFSGNKDPYRMNMTAAMTKEMYFTSFVEGANMQIEEAMEFLNRGTSPENIMEQMIWNNRKAWELMIKNLYSPINEESVRFLAYVLTDGMDRCAENYRQNDQHPIVAMQGEDYEIPMAAQIPGLMSEYYAFMNNPEIHPLIKAPVGAAFLLVTRPFPEGNERLSRLISSMVLLRSGYGFYQDISLSAVIAKETWFYYQSLCEILRSHNEGDLTYFMEYFLEMLVRAVDQKKEQDQHMKEETVKDLIGREQELSRQPLQSTAQSTQGSVNVAPSITSMVPTGSEIESKNNAPPSVQESSLIPDVEDPFWLLQQYQIMSHKLNAKGGVYNISEERNAAVWWLQHLKTDRISSAERDLMISYLKQSRVHTFRMTAFLVAWKARGRSAFSAKDYKEIMKLSKKCMTRDLKKAKDEGVTVMFEERKRTYYRISINEDLSHYQLEDKGNLSEQQQVFLDMIREKYGREEFTTRELCQESTMTRGMRNYYARTLYKQGFLQRKRDGNRWIYWLTDQSLKENSSEQAILVDESKKTMIEEEQAERIRTHFAKKHTYDSGVEYPATVAG